LLADDDRTIHSVIGFFLGQSCIELRSAQNGQEALQMAQVDPPDLLILDRNMPKMDGPAVLAAWSADPTLSRIPVIVLSGKTGEAERAESLAGGAVEYLTKPFNLDDLVARILRAVGRS
jgi:DNA-binding response OmpR family regulator